MKLISVFKKISKKWLIGGLALLLVGSGTSWWAMTKDKPIEEIKTVKVKQGNVSVSLKVDGKTVIDRRDLSFELGGRVVGVGVKEGDEVNQWQGLAWVDAREAQKNLEKALRDYSIQRNSFDEGGQVTYANTALTDTIKRVLENNQWNLEKAVLDVELKDIAQRQSYLASPIKGRVESVSIKPGEVVSASANSTVITVVDENSFYFESFVEDVEALTLESGMKVRITLDALSDQEIEGEVVFVSRLATIDENDLATYKIKVAFSDPEMKLLDGMMGEAEIISKEVADVLMVPNSVVRRDDGKSVVVVAKDGGQEKREVSLGFTNGSVVEVKSGLSLGEEVIDFRIE